MLGPLAQSRSPRKQATRPHRSVTKPKPDPNARSSLDPLWSNAKIDAAGGSGVNGAAQRPQPWGGSRTRGASRASRRAGGGLGGALPGHGHGQSQVSRPGRGARPQEHSRGRARGRLGPGGGGGCQRSAPQAGGACQLEGRVVCCGWRAPWSAPAGPSSLVPSARRRPGRMAPAWRGTARSLLGRGGFTPTWPRWRAPSGGACWRRATAAGTWGTPRRARYRAAPTRGPAGPAG
jgi:hypothetical protein